MDDQKNTGHELDPNLELGQEKKPIINDAKSVSNKKYIKISIFILIALIIISLAIVLLYHPAVKTKALTQNVRTSTSQNKSSSVPAESAQQVTSTDIPTAIDPVNPVAIPTGDGKVSHTPQIGYVDSCITSFSNQGGAQTDGPWIDQTASTWNSVTKVVVQGSVSWSNANYSVSTMGTSLMIETNDIPNHPTGVFPISSSDPAYNYDHNPNSIKPHPATWMLPLNPVAVSSPGCTDGGAVGILNDGVFLYNALDGEGRDAGAHETLDAYQGHPDMSDTYHHHEVPLYLLGSASNKSLSTLVGYAIDGYGIYVERDANGNLLTNANLDACHGRTSLVMWNGKMTDIYHYDATIEYPYTIGCFHGTPIATGLQMKM